MKEAYNRYLKRHSTLTSTYSDFYGIHVNQKIKYDNILNNKTFDKVMHLKYLITPDYIKRKISWHKILFLLLIFYKFFNVF